MYSHLQTWAKERGFRIAFGDVRVLSAAREELTRRRSAGELDSDFYADNLTFFRYEDSSNNAPDLKAVILVAVPRPAHHVQFEHEKVNVVVTLPPTYLRYSAIFTDIRDDIAARIPELHGHLEILVAPLKSIASRMGLVMYGRNNLTYIPDWGSYFQLVGYVTDKEIGIPDDWSPGDAIMMPECENCGACISVCPTGAICEDRILLRAEMCTTLLSEQPGRLNHALGPGCLFGCLECQQVCPANSGLLRFESAGATFDKDETNAILAGDPNVYPENTARKLVALGLTEAALIGRNLAHMLGSHSSVSPRP